MTDARRARYFRAGTFHDVAFADAWTRDWYSGLLERAGEPVLASGASPDVSMVRLLWIPAFALPAVSRVTKRGEAVTLDATLDVMDDRARTRGILPESAWSEVHGLVEGAGFWELPTRAQSLGHDGEMWVVEAALGDRYHVVQRWCPDMGPFRDLGRALARLAGRDLPR